MPSKADAYWQQFLTTRPNGSRSHDKYLEFFSFGYLPEHGRPIGVLILGGKKTATVGILWRRDSVGLPIPSVGDFSIFMMDLKSRWGSLKPLKSKSWRSMK